MGIKERRDHEIAEMKRKIMDAVIEIIEQEGYEKLSIRKIATKIEYSPTTIYLYYKDKAEIIADMSNVLTCKVESNAAAILNDKAIGSIDKQLHRILTSFVLSMCDEPEMVKAIMYSGTNAIFGNESANGVPTNTGIVMLDDFLADGIAHKVFRPDITNTSWMIVSALLGFVMSVIENQTYKLHNFTRLVDDFVGVIMSGLRNE